MRHQFEIMPVLGFATQQFTSPDQSPVLPGHTVADIPRVGDLRPARIIGAVLGVLSRASAHVAIYDTTDHNGQPRQDRYLTLMRSSPTGNQVPDTLLRVSEQNEGEMSFAAITGLSQPPGGRRLLVLMSPDVHRPDDIDKTQTGKYAPVITVDRLEPRDPRFPWTRDVDVNTETAAIDDLTALMRATPFTASQAKESQAATLQLAQELGFEVAVRDEQIAASVGMLALVAV